MQPTFAAVNIFSISKAHEAQMQLSHKIIKGDQLPQKIRFVAGVDVAYFGKFAIGAVAVLNYETFEIVENKQQSASKISVHTNFVVFQGDPTSIRVYQEVKATT